MLNQLLILFISLLLTTFAATNPTMYTYKTIGDLSIKAAVYTPPITPYKKSPVIFAIHSGGFVNGNATSFALSDSEIEEILKRGWTIVSINYRLLPQAFLSDIVQDVQDAFEWVRNDLVKIVPINPDTIAMWGVSAGGGLAAIAGFKLLPRPQAIILSSPHASNYTHIDVYNPENPVSEELIKLANSLRQPTSEGDPNPDGLRWKLFDLFNEEQKAGWMLTTSDPNEPPANIVSKLKQYSAVYNIDENYPPTYLVHGLADTVVHYSQSTEMVTKLKKKGIAYELDLVAGVGHAFTFEAKDGMWEKHVLPMINFAEKYIGTAQPGYIRHFQDGIFHPTYKMSRGSLKGS